MRSISRRQCLAGLSYAALWSVGCSHSKGGRGGLCKELTSRGCQRKAFRDPDGRTIWQMTDDKLASLHSYYDINPWSHDGRYILFASADPAELTGQHTDNYCTYDGLACVMDTRTWEIHVIGDRGFYTTHNGTMGMWHPLENIAYYRLGPERFAAVDLATGKRIERDGKLRQLSPDGKTFVSQLNEVDRPDDPGQWGFYTMNQDGSNARQIISTERLYSLTPNREEFEWQEMMVGNPKWTPDGRHLLITMWVYSEKDGRKQAVQRGGVRRSLFIAKPDGSDIRWLTYFGHHHSWMPSGEGVLFNDNGRMHLIDFDGSNRRAILDEKIGSHPCMSPDCRMIADCDGKGIYVVHIDEQRIERAATFRKQFDSSHKGTHPHCVWSRDGTQVLYNSAETGHSELYMVQFT